MLHDGIVDGVGWAVGERRLVEADEIGIGFGLFEGCLAGGQHVGPQPLQLAEIQGGREQEDAAVPEIIAGGDIALGLRRLRLLDKARHGEGALTALDRLPAGDIAIAGLGAIRRNAERHEPPRVGRLCAARPIAL